MTQHHSVTVNLQSFTAVKVEYDDYIHFLKYGIINERAAVHDRGKVSPISSPKHLGDNEGKRSKKHDSYSEDV